tara:strand:- start:83 stop:496 length:414 start_codon:yes stop_codon:yes gene_type:complete
MSKNNTNPYPINNNLDERKAAKKASFNKTKIEDVRTAILDSNVIALTIASATLGVHVVEDRETGEMVEGEPLPMDILKDYRKTLFNKVIPASKEIVDSGSGDSIELLSEVLDKMEKLDKQKAYLAEEKIIDGDISSD